MIYTGYMPVADTAGFVVAMPDGLVDPLGSQSWNVGWPLQVNNDDVGFLSAFIDTMVDRHELDPSAVFVSGLSNGGFMAFRLACELNGKVAAIANVSASLTPTLYSTCTPAQPFPILMIHGTLDTTIPYEGAAGIAASTHVDSVVKKFSSLYGCDITPQVTTLTHNVNTVNGTSVEHYLYEGCAQNTSIELYRIINGEHVNWPGFDASTNNDFSAAREIWRFFRSYRDCNLNSIASIESSQFEIYPNPSQGLFQINFHQVVSNARYTIYAMDGRRLISEFVDAKQIVEIDLKDFSTGRYTIRVITNNGTDSALLIKY